jgi:hypothetical protein
MWRPTALVESASPDRWSRLEMTTRRGSKPERFGPTGGSVMGPSDRHPTA